VAFRADLDVVLVTTVPMCGIFRLPVRQQQVAEAIAPQHDPRVQGDRSPISTPSRTTTPAWAVNPSPMRTRS